MAFLAAYPSMSAPCRPLPLLPLLPLLSAADVPALSKPQRTRLQKKKAEEEEENERRRIESLLCALVRVVGPTETAKFFGNSIDGWLRYPLFASLLPLPLAFTCALHQAVQNCARPRAFAFKCAAPLSACFLSNPAPVPPFPFSYSHSIVAHTLCTLCTVKAE